MTATLVKETSPPPPATIADRTRRLRRRGKIVALLFVLPALLLLGALVVYPVLFSIGRSFFDASGTTLRRRRELRRDVPRPGDPQGRPQHGHLGRRRTGPADRPRADPRRPGGEGPLGHGLQAAALHADGGLLPRRRHHLPARLRRGPRQGRPQRRGGLRPRRVRGSSSYPTARARDGQGLAKAQDGVVPHECERVARRRGGAGSRRRAARRPAGRDGARVRGGGAQGRPRRTARCRLPGLHARRRREAGQGGPAGERTARR